jgi:hypothetical protein
VVNAEDTETQRAAEEQGWNFGVRPSLPLSGVLQSGVENRTP